MYTIQRVVNLYDLVDYLNDKKIRPSDILKLEKDGNCWLLIYYIEQVTDNRNGKE